MLSRVTQRLASSRALLTSMRAARSTGGVSLLPHASSSLSRRSFSGIGLGMAPTQESASLQRKVTEDDYIYGTAGQPPSLLPQVKSVSRGCVISFTGVPEAAQGSLVHVHSSVPGVGVVRAQVVRVQEHDMVAALLAQGHQVAAGDAVTVPERATDRVLRFPCGAAWLGRTVDACGVPLDGRPAPAPTHLTHQPLSHSTAMSSAKADSESSAAVAVAAAAVTACPSIAARALEGAVFFSGLKHVDLLHPLRRGMRVALVGERSADLPTLAVSAAAALVAQNGPADAAGEAARPPTVLVYACVGQTPAHLARVQALLADAALAPLTTVVFADAGAPPLEQHAALLAAAAQASHLRALGLDAVVIMDDMMAHARALGHLYEGFQIPLAFAVGAEQARLLEGFAPLRAGGSTTALCLAQAQPQLEGVDRVRADAVLAALRGCVDHTLDANAHLAAAGLWPPLEVAPTVSTLRFSFPAFRALVQRLNAMLVQAKEAYENAAVGHDLGIVADEDVVEVIEWRPKLQLILSQARGAFTPPHVQYLLVFAALRPRLLAGIPMSAARGLEPFICARAEAQAVPLMARLREHVLRSAEGPALGSTGAGGLPADLEAELAAFCDDALRAYAASVPLHMFETD